MATTWALGFSTSETFLSGPRSSAQNLAPEDDGQVDSDHMGPCLEAEGSQCYSLGVLRQAERVQPVPPPPPPGSVTEVKISLVWNHLQYMGSCQYL